MTRLRLRMLRLLVHTVGRLSDGINLACRDGMTAGTTLDYIYRNRPSGRSMVGRRLDRIYLSHKSWQAVRERMTLLCEVLAQSVRQMCLRTPSASAGSSSRTPGAIAGAALLLDIASGPARYVLDVLDELRGLPVRATCWDLSESSLQQGRQLARDRGLGNITYQFADAMDESYYRSLPQPPEMIVASGFYDWFNDEQEFRRSLTLVHGAGSRRAVRADDPDRPRRPPGRQLRSSTISTVARWP